MSLCKNLAVWSSPLESACEQAINEHTNRALFNLLGNTIQLHKIEQNCVWAANETGFHPSGGQSQCVIGAAQKQVQHQQCGGS